MVITNEEINAQIARSKAMLAQTAAEGSKPFASSSYDTTLTSTPSASGGAPITSGGLMSFKDTLNQAIQLAKEERNKSSLGFMAGVAPRGTMMASDFNSILSNLNTASDTTTKEALKLATPTYKTEQIGSDLYQYQVGGDGRIIGDPVKILSGKSTTETEKDKLKGAQQKIAKLFEAAERDEDGYVTPEEFRNARQAWVTDTFSGADFDKIFSGQVNPKKAAEYGVNFQTKISSNSEERSI